MQEIEVKFRGDGGEKYEGSERRVRGATERTAQDRVEDEIRADIQTAIEIFLQTGKVDTKFVYKPAPDDDYADSDDDREETLSNAIAQIGCDLALEAAGIDDEDNDETADPDEKSIPRST